MDYSKKIYSTLCLKHWTQSTFDIFPNDLICLIMLMMDHYETYVGLTHTIFVFDKRIVNLSHFNIPDDIILGSRKIYGDYNQSIVLTKSGSVIKNGTYICKRLNIIKMSHYCNHINYDHHSVMISNENLTYSFGKNSKGQLGLGDYRDRKVPKIVNVCGAIKVKCGSEHTCLMTKYTVFACGSNAHGQLGSNIIDKSCSFQIVNVNYIVSIGCGDNFTILLDKHGDVYFCGNIDGNCVKIPTKVLFRQNRRIVSVKCGYTFIVCIDSERNSFIWGKIGLGIGKICSTFSPEQICLSKIISFKTGAGHVIMRTIDNIWGFGSNQYGQLGNKDDEYVHLPRKIDL